MSESLTVWMPGVKTTTPGNSNAHWRIKWLETKRAREAARLALFGRKLPPFPVKVTLIRHSSGKCDKHNLPGAMKAVIDGIADAYGIDDGADGWEFSFDQVKCKRGMFGVEVRIESR